MRLSSPLYLLILLFLHTLLNAQDTAVVDSPAQSEGPELYLVDGDKAHEALDNEKALELPKKDADDDRYKQKAGERLKKLER